ncbi:MULTISPECIES: hypothetical protein [Ignavibacterium]|jgi:hypothetical protein|uniref:hypothetical protein n=1 Tax=Ignavibacterium TaxID=795750 RepID=UPI0025BF0D30|nr:MULTISPECIES: hypothetical protein [Ignavibacterium]MBI5662104.1 hypothetical protein [Ignavibacterium album]
MRPIYLYVDKYGITRKVAIDLAYLFSHKQIRLPKWQFEEGLYLRYLPDGKNPSRVENYFLTKDKIIKEDKDFYYFNFPFNYNQVSEVAV